MAGATPDETTDQRARTSAEARGRPSICTRHWSLSVARSGGAPLLPFTNQQQRAHSTRICQCVKAGATAPCVAQQTVPLLFVGHLVEELRPLSALDASDPTGVRQPARLPTPGRRADHGARVPVRVGTDEPKSRGGQSELRPTGGHKASQHDRSRKVKCTAWGQDQEYTCYALLIKEYSLVDVFWHHSQSSCFISSCSFVLPNTGFYRSASIMPPAWLVPLRPPVCPSVSLCESVRLRPPVPGAWCSTFLGRDPLVVGGTRSRPAVAATGEEARLRGSTRGTPRTMDAGARTTDASLGRREHDATSRWHRWSFVNLRSLTAC